MGRRIKRFIGRFLGYLPTAVDNMADRLATAVVATAAVLGLVSGLGLTCHGLAWAVGGVAAATLVFPGVADLVIFASN
jgi:hypothetical protein